MIFPSEMSYNLFNLSPAFGIMIAPDSDNIFLKGLGAEVQIDLEFGHAVIINPCIMAKWHFYMPSDMPVNIQKIVPYAGLGFSVPIGIVTDEFAGKSYTSTKAGFDVNLNIGCGYELLPKLMLTLDYDLGLGTSVSNSIRIGAVWKFKGERSLEQIGENELYKRFDEHRKAQAAQAEKEKKFRENQAKYPNTRAPGESEAEFRERMEYINSQSEK